MVRLGGPRDPLRGPSQSPPAEDYAVQPTAEPYNQLALRTVPFINKCQSSKKKKKKKKVLNNRYDYLFNNPFWGTRPYPLIACFHSNPRMSSSPRAGQVAGGSGVWNRMWGSNRDVFHDIAESSQIAPVRPPTGRWRRRPSLLRLCILTLILSIL